MATALNYIDRQVLALTAEKIIVEFGLSNEAFGQVIAVFRYGYGIFQILGGFFVDAYGPRVVYPVASGVWSMAGALTGLAETVAMLCGFRFMLGLGEAFNWPCALKVTQGLLPPKDRPLANGIFNSGAPIGALIAPLIVVAVVARYNWRAAFVVTGALGALWVVAWIWYTRGSGEALKGAPMQWGQAAQCTVRILQMPNFWVLAVAMIVINCVNYYLGDWVPLYLETSRGFSFVAGNFFSIVVYAGSFSGNILVGLFVRKLVKLGLSVFAAKKWSLFVSSVLMLSAVLAGFTTNGYVSVSCLALTAAGMAGFLVICITLMQDVDPVHVGITSGLLGGLANLAYGALSPYIGLLADRHETFLILALMGVLPWLAFVAILWGFREAAV